MIVDLVNPTPRPFPTTLSINDLEFNVERSVTTQWTRVWRLMPKVRHVPKSAFVVWVREQSFAESLIGPAECVAEAWHRRDVEWPAWCRSYLSKRTRRVRMARKKRRGWV